MCRFPAICGRHMECACYFADKVSAIGLTPPGSPLLSETSSFLPEAIALQSCALITPRANAFIGRALRSKSCGNLSH